MASKKEPKNSDKFLPLIFFLGNKICLPSIALASVQWIRDTTDRVAIDLYTEINIVRLTSNSSEDKKR